MKRKNEKITWLQKSICIVIWARLCWKQQGSKVPSAPIFKFVQKKRSEKKDGRIVCNKVKRRKKNHNSSNNLLRHKKNCYNKREDRHAHQRKWKRKKKLEKLMTKNMNMDGILATFETGSKNSSHLNVAENRRKRVKNKRREMPDELDDAYTMLFYSRICFNFVLIFLVLLDVILLVIQFFCCCCCSAHSPRAIRIWYTRIEW